MEDLYKYIWMIGLIFPYIIWTGNAIFDIIISTKYKLRMETFSKIWLIIHSLAITFIIITNFLEWLGVKIIP